MVDDSSFRLKLTGKGIHLDRVVSADVAHQVVAIALGATGSLPGDQTTQLSPPASTSAGSTQATTRTPPSVREFLLQQEAKRIPEQIAAIGLYLKNHRNTAVFASKDLVKAFEDAQEPVPKNLPRDVKWTVRIGWIAAKADAKNTYYLTSSGEAAVGAKFPAEVKRRTSLSSGGRVRRRRKKKGVSA